MPTVHEQYEQLFPEYLLGRLSADTTRGVDEHLRICPECRARLDELKPLFAAMKQYAPSAPPAHYFTTVLPRVRERMERRTAVRFFEEPWIARVAAPLGALALMIALVVSLPPGASSDGLKELVSSMESEELVDLLVEETGKGVPSQVSGADAVAATLPEQLASREFARKILGDQNVADAAFPQALADLDKEELDMVLQKLGERTLL